MKSVCRLNGSAAALSDKAFPGKETFDGRQGGRGILFRNGFSGNRRKETREIKNQKECLFLTAIAVNTAADKTPKSESNPQRVTGAAV